MDIEHVNEDCRCEGKKCTKCKQVRCRGLYWGDKRLKSGLKSECQICGKAKHAEWRQCNREYDQERHRVYQRANVEKIRNRGRAYKQRNREKINARYREKYRNNINGFRDRVTLKGKRYNSAHSEERRSYNKCYRKQYAERIKERNRLYRAIHRERISARSLDYANSHREQIQDYRIRTSERRHARWRRYYLHNKDDRREKIYEWRRNNPGAHSAIQATRRARKTCAGGHYTVAEWNALKAQYNHTCLWCGRKEPDIKLTADHVIPVSKHGSSNIDNIQPLCYSCNSRKFNKIIDFRPQNT